MLTRVSGIRFEWRQAKVLSVGTKGTTIEYAKNADESVADQYCCRQRLE